MDDIDDFICPLNKVELMGEWIKGETDSEEDCRSCLLAPVAGWYNSKLKDAGEHELAAQLEEVFNEGDPLTITQKLDTIKASVGKPLKLTLEKYDCMCQTFKQDEAA